MTIPPVPGPDLARIPDLGDVDNFNADAEYIFQYLASLMIPGVNDTVAAINAALVGDAATVIEGVAALQAGRTTLGHRNKIINGQFDIDQRQKADTVGGYTTTQYTLDRWYQTEGAGAVVNVTREPFAVGQTAVPNNPRYYMVFERTTAGSAVSTISHRIEDARTLSGKTATLTFWITTDDLTQIDIQVVQNFGSGGSPSASVEAGIDSGRLIAPGWTKVQLVVTMPSVVGKTFGSNADSFIGINFKWPNSNAGTEAPNKLRFANVSLVEGDATGENDPGTWRDITTERLLCERYFRRFTGTANSFQPWFTGISLAPSDHRAVVPLRAPLRDTPVFRSNAYRLQSGTTLQRNPVPDFVEYSDEGGLYLRWTFGGFIDGEGFLVAADGDNAGYVEFDAEIF